MKKQLSLGAVIVIVLVAVLLTFELTLLACQLSFDKQYDDLLAELELFKPLIDVASAYDQVYLGDLDPELLERYMIYGYIMGTGDKYGNYLTADEFQAFMSDMEGSTSVGIGVLISWNEAGTNATVISVMPDSPASQAGILPGDLLISVGEITLAEDGYDAVTAAIVGEAGTEVTITFSRGGTPYTKTLTRAEIKATTIFARTTENNIGIVRITEFNNTTATDLKVALDEFVEAGITKVVFDMRENPGGALNAVVACLDMLLPEGKITDITDREGTVVTTYTSDAQKYDFKMAVLTNGNTASAAELFSCALQDYNKADGAVDAKLFGTVTYGKGTMQQVYGLTSGGAISISTNYYNPPYSDNYEGIGVTPDFIVALDDALQNKHVYTLTEAEDNQLQAALAYLAS